MKEKVVLSSFISLILVVFLINFVSAQFYGGISGFLDSIGSENIALFIIFGVSGLFIKWALGRTMRDDNKTAGILALLIAFGITAAAHFSGFAYYFDVSELFYFFGISEELLEIIVSLVLIGVLVLVGFKYEFGSALMILGIFLLILSSTDFIYETGITIILGLIFLVLGFWLRMRKKKGSLVGGNYQDYDTPSRPSSRQIYKQELAERRYAEKGRQSQIRARAKNIQEIRRGREKRNIAREQRRQTAPQQRSQQQNQQRAEEEKEILLIEDKRKEKKQRLIEQEKRKLLTDQRKKDREINDLRKKHFKYRRAAESIVSKSGHIPKIGTREYKQWKNYTNAVKTIERMAEKRGERLF